MSVSSCGICLSDCILGTWHTVGAQSVFAACLGSTRFLCDCHSVNIVSGEAAACDLRVSVGVRGMSVSMVKGVAHVYVCL